MVFKSFRFGVLIRISILTLLLFALVLLVQDSDKIISSIVVSILITISISELFQYTNKTNKKLTRLFESIRYSDFSSGFTHDDSLGKSFAELNLAFNEVLNAFRKTRSEKEENWQYLNTVIQQVKSGILSFNDEGGIELINSTAKAYLGNQQIKNIEEISSTEPVLFKLLTEIKPGESKLYSKDLKTQLSIVATEIVIRGFPFKLITMQNIQSELQKKEIESWQNLTRVLRHEIMNSITPIASLTSTMKDIIIEDLVKKEEQEAYELNEETVDDLQEGLETIESRSKGLIRFIDAYRDYTNIPEPKLKPVMVSEFLDHIVQFNKVLARQSKVELSFEVLPETLVVYVDEELMEQVFINLVKNGIEAVKGRENATVKLKAEIDHSDTVVIKVCDNGPGIIPEAIERIFIPFYTTKNNGSGIGLALSRQIVNMHNGSITVESTPEKLTEFIIKI